jgi:FlaA1/EpsC-like NDP-sugar epimerase
MPLDFRLRASITLSRVFDLGFVSGCFLISMAISSSSLTWPGLAEVLVIRIKVVNFVVFVGYLGLCSGVFSACGLYRSHRLSQVTQRLSEICLAVTFITGALLVLKPIFELTFATPGFLLLFWALSFCTLTLSHELALWLLHRARLHGRNLRHVIIVGEGAHATALADRVSQEGSLGYHVLRIIDARGITEDGYVAGNS